ncbi:alpha/beta hydrolase [Zestomonas carbonaria]|uniref:alpha/beta hydrolase n=1 Tax=Zestomonas carbonaria TaxID=2762745 RepID=UPI0038B4A64A
MRSPYPLSPAMAAFVARTRAFAPANASLEAQRAAYRAMCAAFTPALPPGLQTIDGRIGEVPIRCHVPTSDAPSRGWPALLYLHGGGWCLGDLDSHAPLCAWLARRLGVVVVSVDYRLAPEHRFPAGLLDCLQVWRALLANELPIPVDRDHLAVAGDSAGGNLAVALCLRLRADDQPLPRTQALVYPALSPVPVDSHRRHANAPLLSLADMRECLALYLPDATARHDPLALPLACDDLRGLPPAFVAVAQFDPLRDEGVAYARRLARAGIDTRLDLGRGLVHGCLRGLGRVPEVDALCRRLARWLVPHLHDKSVSGR